MTCVETYYRPGDDWHSYPCEKPARFRVFTNPRGDVRNVCGIHVRRYRRSPSYTVEPVA